MVQEEFSVQETKAPFNMAISTLERISGLLFKIREVSIDIMLRPEQKQEMKVQLTRQFFLQASPLLPESVVEKYIDRFNKLKVNSKTIIKTSGSSSFKTNDRKIIFDEDLDVELDLFSLAIQRELQKEKYFMPPKKDMGSTVGRF